MVSSFFSVRECLWLPTWGRMATEADGLTDEIKANLVALCNKMDQVRAWFGQSVNVHVTYRPLKYNQEIGGALHSMHSVGSAMDFNIVSVDCDTARKMIMDSSMLVAWDMRMEDNPPGSHWVHLDCKEVPAGGHRYFIP